MRHQLFLLQCLITANMSQLFLLQWHIIANASQAVSLAVPYYSQYEPAVSLADVAVATWQKPSPHSQERQLLATLRTLFSC